MAASPVELDDVLVAPVVSAVVGLSTDEFPVDAVELTSVAVVIADAEVVPVASPAVVSMSDVPLLVVSMVVVGSAALLVSVAVTVDGLGEVLVGLAVDVAVVVV